MNKANYEKVKEGMSLAEVEKILGKGSKETGDGSNVAAQFGVAIPAGATEVKGERIVLWAVWTCVRSVMLMGAF